ncbi:DUF1641 domain-containing protein [Rubripirellula reticaptiva]|uniref:DUF1641 domain-containing protein n=1 Tax=Rubripirellula reticaptiva TaxID=2528013 RepID=A0A5C6EKR3_9BACT|nr:DUF1641 domain-containing protein [Rubripirellula reticaptiva]TWU49070.1 hypothetical protein Poly59_36830 [Rubripirellula reticaptiva]
METTLQRPSLVDRLNDPSTADVLHRLLDHAESLDQMLTTVGELPNLLAIAVDFFDSVSRKASQEGIDIEQRATSLLKLLVQVTDPVNMQAIEGLVSRLPKLEEGSALLDELPNLVAIAMDVFDEWATQVKAEGIDLEQSLRQGLHAALYLGGQIRREELDRIGFLLKSEVMSENSVATVGMAGSALSSCHQGTCEHPVPKRVGLFGLLGAIRDPNTQRALSFGLQFAKCFGGVLEKRPEANLSSANSSTNQG